MEIEQELTVSSEEFFDFLYRSIKMDIKESTGKNLEVEEITEGMTYSKKIDTKIGRKGGATVTLSTIQPYEKYQASFASSQGENITSYEIEELADNEIIVIYREDFIGSSWLKNMNFKLMNLFYKKSAQKQARDRLKQIEKYIKNQRKNTD
ncbi:MAG: DUF3284 domain-containing protein [Atopostipes suicloacalis]|nr:DUF3284 domain-containing protein [Atopostipes suicloacalis]MDN6730707.1 DUF3284 domain-containing protein [Atopostipes suicloacalis]